MAKLKGFEELLQETIKKKIKSQIPNRMITKMNRNNERRQRSIQNTQAGSSFFFEQKFS